MRMLTFFLQKKNYFVKVEIWSDNNFVRQTLGEDLFRQGYVRKTDESLTNRLVVKSMMNADLFWNISRPTRVD